jgi:hypothetical protein
LPGCSKEEQLLFGDGEIVWMMKEEELLSLFDGNEAVVSSC